VASEVHRSTKAAANAPAWCDPRQPRSWLTLVTLLMKVDRDGLDSTAFAFGARAPP
jgi:hypothetical protein